MPESLQQKVARMTAGMEVTVTFNGTRPGTVTGPVTNDVVGVLFVVGRPVRFGGGGLNTNVTAIDMPDPECPFEIGARVRSASGFDFTVTGRMVWCESCGAWDVEGEDGPGTERALKAPVTLVPPEPAEPDCPAILVTYTDGGVSAFGGVKGQYAAISLKRWLTRPDIATVQALRPAEYLRGGQ